jgi:hypothetical protein
MNGDPSGWRFGGEDTERSTFADADAISSLTSRANQPMFCLSPATAAKSAIRFVRLPGSICLQKESKPFAVR